jgi:membrane fusion protein, multidrug efflux system
MDTAPSSIQSRKTASPGRRRTRWPRVAVFVLTAFGAAGATYLMASRRARDTEVVAPIVAGPAVAVAPATMSDLPITVQALGTVTPLSTVTIKSQISGYLTEIAFKEGQMVRKGDFLAQIDPRPYQASLMQFQGQLIKDQALLRNARLDLQRYQRLITQDSTSHQTVDTAAATVSQYEGIVQSDQAQVDTQKLDIAYCHIVAPADGLLGLRQIDAGNYVQASDTNGLVIITLLQPVSVVFTLPQTRLGAVLKRHRSSAALPVTAYDGDDISLLATGTLETIDNQVDTATGTVKLRAIFTNNDYALFPNQFVNTHVLVDTLHNVLTVPTAAIRHGIPGTYVYLVKADDSVAVRVITTGTTQDGRTMVLSGLSPGDRVVVDGIDRLSDGMKISISPVAGAKP